jgi:hypothetical protein
MRLKVRKIGKGLHPSEVVVEVTTSTGKERLVVDKRSLEENSLLVGSPIAEGGDSLLVELPREAMSGAWRVWVKRNLLFEGKARAA